MRRREFIIAVSIASAGVVFGLSDISNARYNPVFLGMTRPGIPIRYPHGGCTESSIASFDNGPFGRDPFGFYN